MTVRFVLYVLPVLIFFTDRLPQGVGGRSYWLFALIRPKYREDEGLIQHELEHSRQAWKLPLLHQLMYRFSKEYALACEAQAYRVQTKYPAGPGLPPISVANAAQRLRSGIYEFSLTQEEAEALVLG